MRYHRIAASTSNDNARKATTDWVYKSNYVNFQKRIFLRQYASEMRNKQLSCVASVPSALCAISGSWYLPITVVQLRQSLSYSRWLRTGSTYVKATANHAQKSVFLHRKKCVASRVCRKCVAAHALCAYRRSYGLSVNGLSEGNGIFSHNKKNKYSKRFTLSLCADVARYWMFKRTRHVIMTILRRRIYSQM